MEPTTTRLPSCSSARHLSDSDVSKLVSHYRAALWRKFFQLHEQLPQGNVLRPGCGNGGTRIIESLESVASDEGDARTAAEVCVRATCVASLLMWREHWKVVRTVEQILRNQLIKAIGSVISDDEFARFRDFLCLFGL